MTAPSEPPRCARCGHGRRHHSRAVHSLFPERGIMDFQCTARHGDGPWNAKGSCWCPAFVHPPKKGVGRERFIVTIDEHHSGCC